MISVCPSENSMFENRFFDVLQYMYNIISHVLPIEESIFEQNYRETNLDVTRVYSPRKRVFPTHRTVRGSGVVVPGSLVAGCHGPGTRCREVVVRLYRDRGIAVTRGGCEGIWGSPRGSLCIAFLVERF
jgi:hypothetical protein